ncbi:MAG: hypothetical protein WBM09_01150 [Gallionella sp.]
MKKFLAIMLITLVTVGEAVFLPPALARTPVSDLLTQGYGQGMMDRGMMGGGMMGRSAGDDQVSRYL